MSKLIATTILLTLSATVFAAQGPRPQPVDDFQIVPTRPLNNAFAQSYTGNAFPVVPYRPSYNPNPQSNFGYSYNYTPNNWFSPALTGYGQPGTNVSGFGNTNANTNATNSWLPWSWYAWNYYNNGNGYGNGIANNNFNNTNNLNGNTTWFNAHANGAATFVNQVTTTNNSYNANTLPSPYLQSWTRPQNLAIAQTQTGGTIYYTPPTATTGTVNGYNAALPQSRPAPNTYSPPQYYTPSYNAGYTPANTHR